MADARKRLLLHGITAAGGMACALLALPAIRGTALLVERPMPPPGFVAQADGRTTVYAPSPAAARDGHREVRDARDRFRAAFATEAPELVVVLANNPAEFDSLDLEPLQRPGVRLVPFLTRARLDLSRANTLPASAAHGGLLAHEACHAYVAALADQAAGRARTAQRRYGHAALPDWFEESAATLCETPEARASRRRHFREHVAGRIPLQRFATMPHPLGTPEMLRRLGIEPAPGRAQVHELSPARIREALHGADYVLFYSQALSLGEFIVERGGPGALHSLAYALARGNTLTQALRTAPALPATVHALEAEWVRWVQLDSGT